MKPDEIRLAMHRESNILSIEGTPTGLAGGAAMDMRGLAINLSDEQIIRFREIMIGAPAQPRLAAFRVGETVALKIGDLVGTEGRPFHGIDIGTGRIITQGPRPDASHKWIPSQVGCEIREIAA